VGGGEEEEWAGWRYCALWWWGWLGRWKVGRKEARRRRKKARAKGDEEMRGSGVEGRDDGCDGMEGRRDAIGWDDMGCDKLGIGIWDMGCTPLGPFTEISEIHKQTSVFAAGTNTRDWYC